MNKAFTLIEITLVIIIIGLITAGIVGLRHVIHSTNEKAEISKIINLQSALLAYQVREGKQLKKESGKSFINPKTLLDYGATLNDLMPRWGNITNRKAYYIFKTFRLKQDDLYDIDIAQNERAADSGSLLITVAFANSQEVDLDNATFNSVGVHKYIVCAIEKSLDDSDINKGLGRVTHNITQSFDIVTCGLPNTTIGYGYKVEW